MGKNNNTYSQQFDGETQESEEWENESDFEDDSIHARKEHQNHRGRGKGQIRRTIEDFKEQQELKAFLGDDFYQE